MGLFSHGLAVLGGKGTGVARLGELVGRDEVLVKLLLKGSELIGDVGLGLSLQRRAGDLLGVGDVAAETLKREIIGILPVARICLEAGNALPVALGILCPARAVGAEGVRLFSRKLRGRGADLIGRAEVDDVLCLVADERAGLLRHRDQVLGGDDVLIVQIDTADDGHVGFKEDHVVVELDGDILRAAAILDVPDLVLVADEHAGGGHAAVILVDVEQQLHALARRRGLGQDDGWDIGLFNADALAVVRFRPFGIAVRVGFRHLFVAVERFGRGDGHALFVRAELGVGVAPPA